MKAAVDINSVSRGGVVASVAAQISPAAVSKILTKFPLPQVNPFRLIGIFPAQKKVFQWRWNLKVLVCEEQNWKSQQWISSGYDEPQAQRMRAKTFQLALRLKSAGSLAWLRRLHRSHTPVPGPFSTCMHRADAATVSYTEIVATHKQAADDHGPEGRQCVMSRRVQWGASWTVP